MGDAEGNILIVWDRIGDYHRARIREVEEQAGPDRVCTADFGGKDALYGWEGSEDGKRHFLLSPKPVDQLDCFRRCRNFWSILRTRQIRNVAIAGYGRLEYVLFLVLARLLGCRVTLFAESWYGQSVLKNRIKGWFLRLTCNRFFVSGQRAWNHFHECLGIPAKRIFSGYSVVDNAHFEGPAERSCKPVLLSVARFSQEKNLDLLIRAFQNSRLAAHWELRLIGGGPDEDRLRALDKGTARITFAGWIGYADLPSEYANARAFVLPSQFEPWGLVVNEAMAARLPVVVSDACGCMPDLVREGENGFVFKSRDEASLLNALDRLEGLSGEELTQMGRQSGLVISEFSCQGWAASLIASFADR